MVFYSWYIQWKDLRCPSNVLMEFLQVLYVAFTNSFNITTKWLPFWKIRCFLKTWVGTWFSIIWQLAHFSLCNMCLLLVLWLLFDSWAPEKSLLLQSTSLGRNILYWMLNRWGLGWAPHLSPPTFVFRRIFWQRLWSLVGLLERSKCVAMTTFFFFFFISSSLVDNPFENIAVSFSFLPSFLWHFIAFWKLGPGDFVML